jgi:UDP-N-acetylglucosamine 2-epimerase (non-hydrolysing)
VQFVKPFGLDYNKLQMQPACVVSGQWNHHRGKLLALNLPAITIRNAHERPEGMDVGTLIMRVI